MFAVDVKERIIFWNKACEQLLGISEEEALGRACYDVFQACDLSGQAFCHPGCRLASLAQGGAAPEAFPVKLNPAPGKSLKLSMRIALVPSPRLNLWTVVHMLRHGRHRDSGDSRGPSVGSSRSGVVERKRRNGETSSAPPARPLTAREQEVLRLLAEGRTSAVISKKLCISPITVRNHIQHLISKLGTHSQLEAVAYAYRHRLI
jgi:DNA-binding CsgD family transcriptional regulator